MSTGPTDCHCGCGAQLTYADPSPDFKWQHCHQLWLASLYKPDPQVWRAEQRILTLLIRQDFTWKGTTWEFEWLDVHIGNYAPSNGGNVQAGLRYLYEAYDMHCRSWRMPNDLPVLVRT